MFKKTILLITAACVIASRSPVLAASGYSVTELNNTGLYDSQAYAVNNNGDATGDCRTLEKLDIGPRWNADGSRTELTSLDTDDSTIGYSINDAGQIASLYQVLLGGILASGIAMAPV